MTSSTLPANHVKALAKDKNGDLWLGTEDGIAKYDGVLWTNYTKKGITLGYVTAIAIDGIYTEILTQRNPN